MSDELNSREVVFFREFILSLWYRQRAIIKLLDQKEVVEGMEFVKEVEKELADSLSKLPPGEKE